ncbi:hypothetical protein K491DRAFT_782641 [Lophiostoma macrostomum CBS 122681]|uniref:Heterokaryon incompatibility domain-containing protein n=1 Tax=Lophiostoma macrostomum CBS 122681 TaxID=1314788 RepID=A0A6A6SRV4_9PLEO|nr:hypothetical protein K491DRAFT_782641 [Lophiostoma macrostomum CBS 122681]
MADAEFAMVPLCPAAMKTISTRGALLKHNITPRTIWTEYKEWERLEELKITLGSDKASTSVQDPAQFLRILIEEEYWSLECLTHPGSVVPNNPRSVPTLHLAKPWFQTCIKEHAACENARDGSALKRLIKVEATPDGDYLKLVDATRQQDYVTLSYCWGQCTDCRLTTETLQAYYEPIPPNHLLKTVGIWVSSTFGSTGYVLAKTLL